MNVNSPVAVHPPLSHQFDRQSFCSRVLSGGQLCRYCRPVDGSRAPEGWGVLLCESSGKLGKCEGCRSRCSKTGNRQLRPNSSFHKIVIGRCCIRLYPTTASVAHDTPIQSKFKEQEIQCTDICNIFLQCLIAGQEKTRVPFWWQFREFGLRRKMRRKPSGIGLKVYVSIPRHSWVIHVYLYSETLGGWPNELMDTAPIRYRLHGIKMTSITYCAGWNYSFIHKRQRCNCSS